MALTIIGENKTFILPKFDFKLSYRSGSCGTDNVDYYTHIFNDAIRIPITLNQSYIESLVNDDNYIGSFTYATGGIEYKCYKSDLVYPLKNGYTLYLNCACALYHPTAGYQHTDAKSYIVKNDNTGDIWLDVRGGVDAEDVRYFLPSIYMFEDGNNWGFICYISKPNWGSYDYQVSPSRIMLNESGAATKAVMDTIYNALFVDVDNADDPYWQGGNSDTGGGTGTFGDTGDTISAPSLPTLSSADTGLITLFNPTISQLHDLANYLWSDLFDINTFKKVFANPMDAILGLSIVPVSIPNGGAAEVTVGNISTGVSMTKAASQYVTVDCGTLNVKEFWGAYLDYDPYTKCEIYLPYIGTHAVAVDDIMNKAVHVIYHVDILSGACCAFIECNGTVLYTFVGQCTASIPITGNDWTSVVNGALSIAASIGTMVATGGATAPMAAATIASTAVNTFKPSVEKSGSMGGMGGMLGVQTPYLILTRPRQALPKYQNRYTGYPSFITLKLSDCAGYTEIENIHLENIPATESELSEIETLLKGGVII